MIGALKYSDEYVTLFKNADKVSVVARSTDGTGVLAKHADEAGAWLHEVKVFKYSDETAEAVASGEKLLKESGTIYESFADMMSPEDAKRYLDFLENGSREGLTSAELAGVEKADALLVSRKVEYEDVWDLRNVGDVLESGSTTVIYGSDDIANYQYNMIENPGPLAEMPNQPAKNFYGGRYNMEVLQEDRIMYRAGNAQNPYGRWFTSEPPASVANVRIDTAVKTHWIDPKTGAYEASSYIDNVYAIKVPKGTTIYTGPVGPQGGVYVGGYNVMQTYIDAPWTFEVVGKTPLQ